MTTLTEQQLKDAMGYMAAHPVTQPPLNNQIDASVLLPVVVPPSAPAGIVPTNDPAAMIQSIVNLPASTACQAGVSALCGGSGVPVVFSLTVWGALAYYLFFRGRK